MATYMIKLLLSEDKTMQLPSKIECFSNKHKVYTQISFRKLDMIIYNMQLDDMSFIGHLFSDELRLN